MTCISCEYMTSIAIGLTRTLTFAYSLDPIQSTSATISNPSEIPITDPLITAKMADEPPALPLFHPTPSENSKQEQKRALTPGPAEPATPPSEEAIPDSATATLLAPEDHSHFQQGTSLLR